MERVNYCLVCGTSETRSVACYPRVIYRLIFGNCDTFRSVLTCVRMVNYYLDYRTSETDGSCARKAGLVNYYLDYGSSETKLVLRTFQAG